MRNLPELKDVAATSDTDLAKLDTDAILALRSEAAEKIEWLAKAINRLNMTVRSRYQSELTALRLSSKKDTGTVSFQSGDYMVKSEIGKTVKWDQDKLETIYKAILMAGDQPSEYIKVTYSVGEREYNAWPDLIKARFAPARTVKPGAENITVERIEE